MFKCANARLFYRFLQQPGKRLLELFAIIAVAGQVRALGWVQPAAGTNTIRSKQGGELGRAERSLAAKLHHSPVGSALSALQMSADRTHSRAETNGCSAANNRTRQLAPDRLELTSFGACTASSTTHAKTVHDVVAVAMAFDTTT